MKMKKAAVLLAFGFAILSSSLCSAKLPGEQMALGGITLGMSKQQVYAIQGKPVALSRNGFAIEYGRYGTTFQIRVSDSEPVRHIYVVGNNGIATPAGVKVGTSYEEVIRLLGKPDYDSLSTHNTIQYSSLDDKYAGLIMEFKNGRVCRMFLTNEGC